MSQQQIVPLLVRPALYKFSGVPWAWHRLTEVLEMLKVTPKELWEEYLFLSKDYGVLRVTYGDRIQNLNERDLLAVEVTEVFVPAGWFNDILDENFQREHGCSHKVYETTDFEVPCDPACCPQHKDAPNGIGHTCGNRYRIVCERCGAELENSYRDVGQEYETWRKSFLEK